MISYWTDKGVVLEYNHGAYNSYWRKVWAWDDGDGVPESGEMQWFLGLQTSDVFNLDNDYPSTTFLRSCLCGKPEVNSLGKYLLYHGSSYVICATRAAWVSSLTDQGMGYHFLNRLMKDTLSSDGVIGNAHDLARIDYMLTNDFWINLYLFTGYGDPATRQFGRLVGMEESADREQKTEVRLQLTCVPNPFRTEVRIQISEIRKTDSNIKLEIFDVAGRRVGDFILYPSSFILPAKLEWDGRDEEGNELGAGVYFLKLQVGKLSIEEKILLIR